MSGSASSRKEEGAMTSRRDVLRGTAALPLVAVPCARAYRLRQSPAAEERPLTASCKEA
jgi:hypothetical protein